MLQILRQGVHFQPLPATSTPILADVDRRESTSWLSHDVNAEEDAEAGAKALMGISAAAHLLLAPDMDMSSAIALSKELHHKKGKRSHSAAFGEEDDNRVRRPRCVSIEEASQVPSKVVRDELVKLYFQHFHPFCPVVDEFDFMEVYERIENDAELENQVDLTLFQAMMFVAIGFTSRIRLRGTPYASIYEYQRAYFEKASLLYRARHTSDHMVLTQTALLLTYWSPFDDEYKVNNYWVDRAFYHARAIHLQDIQSDCRVTSSRRRIVWWCCLLRDRLVAMGLRRPYRLQEARSTWPVVDKSDFGLEVMFPKFINVDTKRAMIDSFIWLCKLSDIVRDLLVFHESNRFDREWSDSRIDGEAIMPELTKVSSFDSRLRSWEDGYRKSNDEYIKSFTPGRCKIPNYILLINNSLLASLYLPYIHCPDGSIPLVHKFQKVALRRIKAVSSAMAIQVRKLWSTTRIEEEFMVGIVAWIALPMVVFKILPETSNVSPEANVGRYSDFVPFLSALATRFPGAKLFADMMDETTTEIVDRSRTLGITKRASHKQLSGVTDLKIPDVADCNREVAEAEVLSCVAKMVNLRFSTAVSY